VNATGEITGAGWGASLACAEAGSPAWPEAAWGGFGAGCGSTPAVFGTTGARAAAVGSTRV